MLSIGIHIGKHSACFAELSAEGGRLKESVFFEEKFFAPSCSEEEKLSSVFNWMEEIKQKHKGRACRFCLGLPQGLITSFSISFPFKEKFKILKTLPFEIEDKSPFPSEKVFFDARISRIQGKNSQAICFAAPMENIQPFLESSFYTEKTSFSLSCEGAGLANVLEFWNKPLSQPQVLSGSALRIYLGMENSLIFCYKEGHLINILLLDWGIEPAIKEMEELYQLSLQKAREEFFSKAFILSSATAWSKDQVFFSNLIKKHISGLIPKLKLLKISIETKQKLPVEEALIFGPGAIIKNLSAFLSAEISINVSKMRGLPAFPFFNWTENPSFLPAFGLSLEGLKSSPYKGLDFLHSKRKDAFSLFPKKWRAAAFACLLCFAFFAAYAFIRKTESQKILDKSQNAFKSYGSKITGLRESKIHPDNLKSFLEKEKKKIALKQKIQKRLNSRNPMDSLSFISKELKKTSSLWGLSLNYLKVENEKIDIRGFIGKTFLEEFENKLKSLSKGSLKKGDAQLKSPALKGKDEISIHKPSESPANQLPGGPPSKEGKTVTKRGPSSVAKKPLSLSPPLLSDEKTPLLRGDDLKGKSAEAPPTMDQVKEPAIPIIIGEKDRQKTEIDPLFKAQKGKATGKMTEKTTGKMTEKTTRKNTEKIIRKGIEKGIGKITEKATGKFKGEFKGEFPAEEIEKVFFSYSFELKEPLKFRNL